MGHTCGRHAVRPTRRTGSIQGRIYNPVSREYVRNAEVRLDGTNQVTYSENGGSLQFARVAAGAAAITVTYTGYHTMNESFTVTAGQPAVREINLVQRLRCDACGGRESR